MRIDQHEEMKGSILGGALLMGLIGRRGDKRRVDAILGESNCEEAITPTNAVCLEYEAVNGAAGVERQELAIARVSCVGHRGECVGSYGASRCAAPDGRQEEIALYEELPVLRLTHALEVTSAALDDPDHIRAAPGAR